MRIVLSGVFLLLPVIAFAQVKRINPPTLSTPTGYTHIVEVKGLVRPDLMLDIEVIAVVPNPRR